jgi:hypothetical protein
MKGRGNMSDAVQNQEIERGAKPKLAALPTVHIKPKVNDTQEQDSSSRRSAKNLQKTSTKPVPKSKPEKPDWKESLPDWLIYDQPASGFNIYWIKWWLYARLGMYKWSWIPIPRFVNYRAESRAIDSWIRSQRSLSQCIGCVGNASGGIGKTSITGGLLASLRDAHDMSTIGYDGDVSDPNLLPRFHLQDVNALTGQPVISGKRLVQRLIEGWRPTYRDLIPLTAIDEDSGIMFVTADTKAIDEESSILIMERLKETTHTLIADTEPGIGETRGGTHGLVRASDIIVIAGDASQPKSFPAIERTFTPDGLNLRNADGEAPNVILAFGAVNRRDFNSRIQFEYADRYGVKPDRVVLIPYSKYIRGDPRSKQMNKMKLSALSDSVVYGYKKLAKVWTEMAVLKNQSLINASDTLEGEFETIEAVPESSDQQIAD